MVNGSGYTDPTAGKALLTVMREERKMGAKGYADGDIVTVEYGSGEYEALLLKCHSSYATTLRLTQKRVDENCIQVRSREMLHADAGKLGYVPYHKITSLVREMTEEELELVKSSVARAIGVEPAAVASEARECVSAEIDYDAIADRIFEKMRVTRQTRDEAIRCETERDVYKSLFESVMRKERNDGQ